MKSLAIMALIGAASAGTLSPRVLQKQTVSQTTYPNAMCNDGTPIVYYFDAAPSGSAQSNIWIVYLQDGGWCWNKLVCDNRVIAQASGVSSSGYGATYNFALGSVLNAGGSYRFADANVIYVRYCTSDAHIGNAAAAVPFSTVGGSASNLAFRGREAVKAVTKNLVDVHGMSTTTPQTVVLAGSSAGGRGVLHNLNHLKTDFAGYGWSQATVYGIIDSGLYVNMPTIDWTKTDLDIQAKNIVTYNLADIDPICSSYMVTTYGNTGAVPSTVDSTGQNWRCLMGAYAIDTLQAPHVLHQFQMDAWQTFVNLPIPYGWATTQILSIRPAWGEIMARYRQLTRTSLLTPPTTFGASAGGTRGVHSSACYQHMNLQSSRFTTHYKVKVGSEQVSLANIVDSFIFGAPGVTHAVENCTGPVAGGWECGADCIYTRGGAGSPSVCGWWYWFTALRTMSPRCQNSLVDYHVSGQFYWSNEQSCPCLNALPASVVANHQCPHLFAYGYSDGVPAPALPQLFPNRPTQQPWTGVGAADPPAPMTLAQLGQVCQTYTPAGACAPFCNAYTCGMSQCSECSVCSAVRNGEYCASWCNHALVAIDTKWSFTCGMTHCLGCAACPTWGPSIRR